MKRGIDTESCVKQCQTMQREVFCNQGGSCWIWSVYVAAKERERERSFAFLMFSHVEELWGRFN